MGVTAGTIARSHGVSAATISNKIKILKREGIIEVEGKSSSTTYKPTPGTRKFILDCEAILDPDSGTGGAEGEVELALSGSKEFNLSNPTLGHYTGDCPRTHNLQFTVKLEKPGIKGYWGIPSLPKQINWIKEWEPNSGSWHSKGLIKLEQWANLAEVHYINGKKSQVETLQIVLPCAYILKSWLDEFDKVEQYFYNVARKIGKLFQKTGYKVGNPELTNRRIHHGFTVPVFKCFEDLKSHRFSDTLWLDFSHGEPELETNDPDEARQLAKAIPIFKDLPWIKRTVMRHEQIIRGGMMVPNEYFPTYNGEGIEMHQ